MLIRITVIGVIAIAASALAQPPGPPPGRGPGRFGSGPEGVFGSARFLGAEAGMPGRVVRNAPFTADVVTESSQTLPDGNRIHQVNTVRMYRDSEGRTRSEQTLKTLSGLAPTANLPPVVFINDPVIGANYALNPTAKTANKSTWSRPAAKGGEQRSMGRGPGPRHAETGSNVKVDALGTQTVDGVPAEGKRVTVTIPAGEIGNEQPIQVVSETWYSPDLKMVVLSKRSDPRMGETTTRMTNVSRAEPAAALFQVPADFKITEGATRAPRSGTRPQ